MPMTKRILIVSDAWYPQTNGVVRTLDTVGRELRGFGHTVIMITPDQFKSVPCPTYPEIRLSYNAWSTLPAKMDAAMADHIHIATEGPLGLAARRYCLKSGRHFTTSFHTRFPEYLYERFYFPTGLAYRWMRHFHNAGQATMVATPTLQKELIARGFTKTALWSRGVDTALFQPLEAYETLFNYPRPILLYVGRIAVEKNIEAFLSLTHPGTKLVVGDGPQMASLQKRFPDAVYVGRKEGKELASYYAGSDVFVFPSHTDTFGLVMLEALACGTPVAAYPVTGPVDVICDPTIGAMDQNLEAAVAKALTLRRDDCVAFARNHSWARCAERFFEMLVPAAVPGETLRKSA